MADRCLRTCLEITDLGGRGSCQAANRCCTTPLRELRPPEYVIPCNSKHILSSLPALAFLFVAVGCSSMDRRTEPTAVSVVPQNRATLHADHDLDAGQTSVIRSATFDKPAESGSAESPDLLSTPLNSQSVNATLEPRTVHDVLSPPVVSGADRRRIDDDRS